MLITIPTAGTRGDVQPAIALGLALELAGFQVRIVAFNEYRELVTEYGLDFFPLQVNMQDLLERHGKGSLIDSGMSKIIFVPELIRIFREMYEQMAFDIYQAAQGSAIEESSVAVIGNAATAMLSSAVAEKIGAAYIETSAFPGWPTRSFPTLFWPWASRPGDGRGLRGTLNRLSYKPIDYMAMFGLFPIVNRCRRRILGLPPLAYFGKGNQPTVPVTPILAHFSTHVLPRPVDWEERIHVTGYWFVETPAYRPPAELEEFLQAGPPPVYIGFGSMPSKDPEQMAALIAQALHLAGQRGLLFTSSGLLGGGMTDHNAKEDILAIGSTPYDWLFPRCAAVVHHGGAGTTASALRAGIPSIVVPTMPDQPFWAQRVEELGVGPKPIPRTRLTAERLAEAIRQALTDQAMHQRAAALGEKINAEDGIAIAVSIISLHIENHVESKKSLQ